MEESRRCHACGDLPGRLHTRTVPELVGRVLTRAVRPFCAACATVRAPACPADGHSTAVGVAALLLCLGAAVLFLFRAWLLGGAP